MLYWTIISLYYIISIGKIQEIQDFFIPTKQDYRQETRPDNPIKIHR